MLSTEQKLQRREGIGGSDVSTILGLNPWKTAEQLRLEKLGIIDEDADNDNMLFGHYLEEPIARLTSERMGYKVRKSNQTITHPKYNWLFAHIDRKIEGERRGLEIKNVSWRMAKDWGEQGTDEIPDYYLPQPHTYMLILDYLQFDVSAYFGGSDLRFFTVKRDREFEQLIIDRTHDFWFCNVKKDQPCVVDYESEAATRLYKKLYTGTDGTAKHLDHVTQAVSDNLRTTQLQIRQLQVKANGFENQLKAALGDCTLGVLPDGTGYQRKMVYKKESTVAASQYIKRTFTEYAETMSEFM